MTDEQMDDLMTLAVNMQREAETDCNRPSAMFAYSVQVAVLEIRETRCKYEELQSQNTDMAVQLANAESKCRELAGENEKQNTHSEALAVDNAALREVVERMVNQFAMSGISPEEKSINPAKSLMFDAKSALFMPATDAFLAEVLASELDSLAGVAETMLVKFSNQRCSQDMHEVVGWKMVLQQASNRAAKLRKGAVL
ncbi:hypothetical protein ACNSOB_09750 [Citrobacter braakii]|uniref:hypothetical protein n=1 Tax=Citrobacter braakii TaxID=57706 RepID=UPI003AB4AC8F